MAHVTHLQRLLSERLEASGHPPLDDLVATLRAERTSWRKIAAEITRITEQPCSATNLHGWYDDNGQPSKKKTVAS